METKPLDLQPGLLKKHLGPINKTKNRSAFLIKLPWRFNLARNSVDVQREKRSYRKDTLANSFAHVYEQERVERVGTEKKRERDSLQKHFRWNSK